MPTFAFFRGTILAWGGGARLYPGGARRNLLVRVLTHKFRSDDQKKILALNLRLRFGIHSCVLSWNETLLIFGEAQAVFWGAQAPKCTLVAPGKLFSFGTQSSLGWADFSLGKAQAVIWEARPRNVPHATGPECHQNITTIIAKQLFFHYKLAANLLNDSFYPLSVCRRLCHNLRHNEEKCLQSAKLQS